MSPEHAANQELTPASDWYSFGVILYEALTGRLPIDGPPLRLLADKQCVEPPPPAHTPTCPPTSTRSATICSKWTRRDGQPARRCFVA